jgi:CheY-like chemotaxis protein
MRFLLPDSLEIYGYRVTHFSNGKEALIHFRSQQIDVCIGCDDAENGWLYLS